MGIPTLESSFFCCSLRTGTKIIAWIQLVLMVLGLLVLVLMFNILSSTTKEFNKEFKSKEFGEFQDSPFYRNSQKQDSAAANIVDEVGYAVMAIIAVLALIQLVSIILLLLGAQKERAGYLKLWLVLAIVSLILSILSFTPKGWGAFVINLYFTWVVYSYFKQLKDAESPGEVIRRGKDQEFGPNVLAPTAPPPYAYPQK